MAAFAPMPSASERTATTVTNGVLKRVRKASLRLRMVDWTALTTSSLKRLGRFLSNAGSDRLPVEAAAELPVTHADTRTIAYEVALGRRNWSSIVTQDGIPRQH